MKSQDRLIERGFCQISGVGFTEIFNQVAVFETIRILLAAASQKKWKVNFG